MNPIWVPAVGALTSALERRGDLLEAVAVCERALQHAPHEAPLHVYRASLLWRLQRTDAALTALEAALRIDAANDDAWDLLARWSEQSGDASRPQRCAAALANERPGDVRVWMMLARFATTQSAEQLTALERALQLEPSSVEIWDLKAELLVFAERFDEALAVCDAGAAACPVGAYVLRGRRAWIEAQRRDHAAAIESMRAVLAENANYPWGWHQLSGWLLDAGRIAEAQQALEQLRRLRPHDSRVHCQLGRLYLEDCRRDEAARAFAAALEAEPTNHLAAQNLIRLQLDDRQLAAAAGTLRIMQLHQPGAATVAAEVALHLKHGDVRAAATALGALCETPDPDPEPLEWAIDAFAIAGYRRAAQQVLNERIRAGTMSPNVGAALLRWYLAQRAPVRAVRAFLRMPAGELQSRAAGPLVQGLAQRGSRWLVQILLWRRREILHRDHDAWAQVGYALTSVERMRQVVDWLADWRQRPNVEPWAL
ncbi:MAG: tetratricopeptide repeat protein, partial [Steroidobacteraceae bacterium]|nr:tetratricopeptide repeat protein [Steroidobacteraceae bacterium]